MKRVFTKEFHGEATALAPGWITAPAKETWLAQEDIEVVAAELNIYISEPSENDGFGAAEIELSQVGVAEQDGVILKAVCSEGWNTTPAGITATNGHAFLSFPAGYAIPVREEGTIYLHLRVLGKSAGITMSRYGAIIYYTKKSSR